MFYTINLQSQTIVIKGNIKNFNNKNIEFATIQLLFNSTTVKSALSDSLGNYYIETTKKGKCKLLTNMLGYLPVQKEIVLRNDTTINFTLQVDTTILDEVTVFGQKNLIQAKSDRFVVNIGGNIETKGKETTDILKQLPTVNISDKSLNIFGKSAVIVYINDHIVRLNGQSLLSYLNSLPPDIIESIEIISTPPAQYSAEGNVGIIKIITKKNISPGWKEYFKTVYVQNNYSSYLLSAFASYRGKKIFFEGSIRGWNSSNLNQSNYYSYFPNETVTTFNPKKWNSNNYEAQASLGYDFNKRSTIIADFQIPLYNKVTITDIKNQTNFINPANNQTDSTIYSNGKTMQDNYTYNTELFFKHLFPNQKSYFTASTAFLNNQTKSVRDFSSIIKIGNTELPTEDYSTKGNYNYNILTSKLDFSFPLLSFAINTGLKLSFIKTNSDNKFFNVIGNNYFLDTSSVNKFDYTENVQALYYSMEKNIAKWSFKAGIRSEITQTTGHSLITNEQHNENYINFFPTIYISHKLNSKNNISLNYADRIERPPYQFLNPFKWYITKYDYAVGNPFLKPSYIKNIELIYLHNNTFSTKLYYTYQNDKIGRYVILDSLNINNQIQKADNFLNINSYGINIYKFIKLFNRLETVLQGDFSYSEYLSNRKEFSDISGINGEVTMNNTLHINEKIQAVCNIEEHIPGLYDYRNTNNFFKLDIGLNYINSKKGFEVRFFINDILKTANPEYSYISGGIKQIYRNYYDTRLTGIVLTWRPGNWFNKSEKINNPSNIDEKQRL